MPKEFIECADFGREFPVVGGSDGPVETATWDTDAIKVGWSKEAAHVEVAVVQMVEGLYVEHGFLLEDGADISTEEAVRLAKLEPRYIQLDRHGINRLIRSLRKARDDAFGKDA